ncbi:MAG: response regulator [Candidatus Omnitrophica bacterium]|nr:response regulator [Candidatus Omnitrophota bacterium]
MKLSLLEKILVAFGLAVMGLTAAGWISYWSAAIFLVVALAFVVVERDFTGRRQAETALLKSQREVQLLLDSTVEAIYGLDAKGRCNFCNPACLELLGYQDQRDLLGRNMHELIHHTRADGSFFPEADCFVYQARQLAAGTHRDDEVYWRADGTSFPVEYWSYPIRDGKEVLGTVVTFLDISERKRTEQRLNLQHRITCILADCDSLESAAEKILYEICRHLGWGAGVLWTVREETLQAGPCHAAGVPKDALDEAFQGVPVLRGKGLLGLAWEERKPVWSREIKSDPAVEGAANLSRLTFEAALAFPVILGDRVLGVLEFFTRQFSEPDPELLTLFASVGSQLGQYMERRRAAEDLEQARDEAVQASQSKSEFLATMSHEIRTPMNAILGMTELLAETPLTSEQKEYLQILKRGGESLLKLINDVLDLSKVESGQMEAEQKEFNLREFMDATLEFMAFRAHQKGLELTCRILPGVPETVIGDSHRLRQILVNLVGNAIKFTHKGEIYLEIILAERPSAAGNAVLRFSVRDTGIGIPAEKIHTIFSPFSQADSSTTRRYGGTGLGLSISKKLIEFLGGNIRVESKILEGTTFYFDLPFGFQSGKPQVAPAAPIPQEFWGTRTLIVDDNATSRFVLKEILETWGFSVREAEAARACFTEIRSAAERGAPYQLLFIDCRMSGMGGFEVARWVRNEISADTAILMLLTADARASDAEDAKNLGVSASIVKPVKKQSLRDAVLSVMEQRIEHLRRQPADQGIAEKIVRDGFDLLLVDDSDDNRLLIKAYLKRTPYRIDIAENGQIALQKFISGHYDLILMDMHMPYMDGYTATRQIRDWEVKHSARTRTPIIALTADAFKADIAKCLDAGCDSHLAKPIKKEDLLKTVSGYCPPASGLFGT